MMEASQDPTAIAATDLLDRYGFDVGAFSAQQLVGYWLRSYPSAWVRAAVVEALYQGRYKSVSVGQILAIWKRRGQPIYHFSFEFERMVCGNLSRIPTQDLPSEPPLSEPTTTPAEQDIATEDFPAVAETTASEPLPSEKTAPLEPISEKLSPPRELEIVGSSVPNENESTSDFELLTDQNSWARNSEGVQHQIHQFVPDPEISMFYEKLRAVAQDQQN